MFLLGLDTSNSRGANIAGVTDNTFELVIIIVNRLKASLL